MKRGLSCLLLSLLATMATADLLINTPPDRLTTVNEVEILKGQTSATPESVLVNQNPIPRKADRSFGCGLVLKVGKNLARITDGEQQAERRLLRLQTFPDCEQQVKNKKYWARNQIVYLASLGIIEGAPDGNFYPAQPITRGEFATWLCRARELPLPKLTTDVFYDLPKEHWRAPYVKAVVDAGLMAGLTKDSFGVDEYVSRWEAANIAWRGEGETIVEKIKPVLSKMPKEENDVYVIPDHNPLQELSDNFTVVEPYLVLTRAETAALLANYATVEKRIGELFNFEKDYGNDQLCSVNLAPQILAFTVQPEQVSKQALASLKLRVTIAPRGKFLPLAKVTIDLSRLGGAIDAEMIDDGTRGDEVKDDLTYSLNVAVQPKKSGKYQLTVTATDQLGWEGKQIGSLLVLE